MTSTTVGIACSVPSERAAFVEWLAAVGCPTRVDARPQGTDARSETAAHRSARGQRRSRVAARLADRVEDPHPEPAARRRRPARIRARRSLAAGQVALDRPTSADALAIGVALALAEGRPVRRSARKSVLYLPATVNGVVSQVVDVSDEGVRLQLKNDTPSTLPALLHAAGRSVWCGCCSSTAHGSRGRKRAWCCAGGGFSSTCRNRRRGRTWWRWRRQRPRQSPRSNPRRSYWSPRVAKYTTLGASDRAAPMFCRPSRSRSAMSKP